MFQELCHAFLVSVASSRYIQEWQELGPRPSSPGCPSTPSWSPGWRYCADKLLDLRGVLPTKKWSLGVLSDLNVARIGPRVPPSSLFHQMLSPPHSSLHFRWDSGFTSSSHKRSCKELRSIARMGDCMDRMETVQDDSGSVLSPAVSLPQLLPSQTCSSMLSGSVSALLELICGQLICANQMLDPSQPQSQ